MNLLKKKKNGEVKLPPGFRFHPTDEELVVQYLKRKVFSFPLPASIIPELRHLSNSDPWDLPGNLEEERYFFSTKEAKYPNGNRSNRATNSGYWKATGLDKQILNSNSNSNSNSNVVVGMKKTLVFYKGKPPHGSRTDWIMHEYRLTHHSSSLKENWVVCRIFLKRRGSAKNGGGGENTVTVREKPSKVNNSNSNSNSKMVVFYDFLSSPILSATSGITEEHNENENEDSSSSFPSLTINNNNNNNNN